MIPKATAEYPCISSPWIWNKFPRGSALQFRDRPWRRRGRHFTSLAQDSFWEHSVTLESTQTPLPVCHRTYMEKLTRSAHMQIYLSFNSFYTLKICYTFFFFFHLLCLLLLAFWKTNAHFPRCLWQRYSRNILGSVSLYPNMGESGQKSLPSKAFLSIVHSK